MKLSSHLLDQPAGDPTMWTHDPNVVFLNHGAFGSCPRPVLDFQRSLRDRMEREPLDFLWREIEPMIDEARIALAQFVGADANNLVFVPNATGGVNSVLRSLQFAPGDELLVTNHEYNACRNALDYVAERSGATVVVADVPFPLESPNQVVSSVISKATERTKLALFDHVTSQTGMVMPAEKLVGELAARGIDTLIDGAHASGMLPLDLRLLGATYYSGNCHKWLCGPKAAGFLHVQPDRQKLIRPLSISHGANSPRTDRSRFLIEFGWTGTHDPTPYLSVPEAIRVMGSLLPGGWAEWMARNRQLALAARTTICAAINARPPCPDECIGSLAVIPLPDAPPMDRPAAPLYIDPIQDCLRSEHGVEAPIFYWPSWPKRWIRVSAQGYNSLPQYERLAGALKSILK